LRARPTERGPGIATSISRGFLVNALGLKLRPSHPRFTTNSISHQSLPYPIRSLPRSLRLHNSVPLCTSFSISALLHDPRFSITTTLARSFAFLRFIRYYLNSPSSPCSWPLQRKTSTSRNSQSALSDASCLQLLHIDPLLSGFSQDINPFLALRLPCLECILYATT